MAAMSTAEAQDLVNVTADSLARHCGLVNDPANPDTRSEESRFVALRRQLALVQRWPRPRAEAIYCELSAKHLPQLVVQYQRCATPFNIAMMVINIVCHLPYFIRFQKTPAASDLVVLQATRIANTMGDSSPPEIIAEVCQFLSTLLVLQGTTAIPEDVKQKLIPKLSAWRCRYNGQFPGETAERCYQALKGSLEMTRMTRMMKEQLEMPLSQCGFPGCGLRVDSVGRELKQCSRQAISLAEYERET